MNLPKLLLTLISFSSFISCVFTLKCKDHKCDSTRLGTIIQYPFRVIDHHPIPCGYPGFNVQCNGTTTKLELPNSIILEIENIHYKDQKIELSDPNGCLPSKIMSLNLSNSPLYAMYYQEYAVFNCSGYFDTGEYNQSMAHELKKVDCLSDFSYTVYAVNSHWSVSLLSSSCRWVGNMSYPDENPLGSFVLDPLNYPYITLHWDNPRCGPCAKLGRRCRVKSDFAHEVECTSRLIPMTNGNQNSQIKKIICC